MKRSMLTRLVSLALVLLLGRAGFSNDSPYPSELHRWLEVYTWLLDQEEHRAADKLAARLAELHPDDMLVRLIVENARLRGRRTEIAQTPLESPVVDQVTWEKVAQRQKTQSAEEDRIQKALSTIVSVQFEETALQEALDHLSDLTGANIVVEKYALMEEGVTPQEPVTMHVEGVQARSVLALLLKPLSLDYVIEDEVIKVTNKQRTLGDFETRVYSVADLVSPLPKSVTIPAETSDPAAVAAQGEADFFPLTRMIETSVDPDGWASVGGMGHIAPHAGTLSLVVRQTAEVHDEVALLLEQIRRTNAIQIGLDVVAVRVSKEEYLRLTAASSLEWYGNRTHVSSRRASRLKERVRNAERLTICSGNAMLHQGQTCLLKRMDAGFAGTPFGCIYTEISDDRRTVALRIYTEPTGDDSQRPTLITTLDIADGTTCVVAANKPSPIVQEIVPISDSLPSNQFTQANELPPEAGDGVIWDDAPDGVTLVMLTPTLIVPEEEEELLGIPPQHEPHVAEDLGLSDGTGN